jgi:hypothetical protein
VHILPQPKDEHSNEDHAFSVNPLFETKLIDDGKQNAVLKERTTEGVKTCRNKIPISLYKNPEDNLRRSKHELLFL